MPNRWILFNYTNNSPKTTPHLNRDDTKYALYVSKWDRLQIAQQAYHYTFKYPN